MEEQFISFIEALKTDSRIESFDEAATKQGIILRILFFLGWDHFNIDEVTPEYSVSGKRVDYSLRTDSANKVFIEVKQTGVELDNHQEQLLNYAFQEGVRLAILTNGLVWWFYLPLNEGNWEDRKFYTIHIPQQGSEDVVSKFRDFVDRGNIGNGKAIENAEAVYKGQQRLNTLNETIPRAWNQIISEADELLVDLLIESTEEICGFKPDKDLIVKFITGHKDNLLVSSHQAYPTPAQPSTPAKVAQRRTKVSQGEVVDLDNDYCGKRVTAFYFQGEQFEVRMWKEILVKLCEAIAEKQKGNFKTVFGLRGRKRIYFSKNKSDMREGRIIENTGIFVETHFSSKDIIRRCFDVLNLFGYSSKDFRIDVE